MKNANMFDEMLAAFADKPVSYARMAHPFWDDDHISKNMLAAHLNPELDAASRTHAFIARSAEWIATLSGGALLDLGCGPGIYAEQFALCGLAVTGVDMSRRSIAHAKASAAEKGLNIRYVCKSYLEIECRDAFDAAVLIYCDYGVLPPEDRALVLRRAYEALRPGGIFLVDAWTSAQYADFAEGWTVQESPDGGFWSPDAYIEFKRQAAYPDGVFLENYHILTKDALRTYHLWNRAYTGDALTEELVAAGFSRPDFFGDVAGKPVAAGDRTLCAVARK